MDQSIEWVQWLAELEYLAQRGVCETLDTQEQKRYERILEIVIKMKSDNNSVIECMNTFEWPF